MLDGATDTVGLLDGNEEGLLDGVEEGAREGLLDGAPEGLLDGVEVGALLDGSALTVEKTQKAKKAMKSLENCMVDSFYRVVAVVLDLWLRKE